MNRADFPEDFIIGCATASYQVEGAGTEDGRTDCIWDTFSKKPGAVYKKQDGKIASDQYHRYKEDVALMKKLGFSYYRFSVSWSRVLPHGGKEVNEKGINYYINLCDELHKNGIKTCCTIYHWDLPKEIQDEGGWAVRSTSYKLAYLAKILFERLADKVDMWITINESMCVTYLGYYNGIHAPGIKDEQQYINAVHYINLAHGLIVNEYRKTGLQAPIGITHNFETPRPASKDEKDAIACAHHRAIRNEIYFGPQMGKGYPDYVVKELKWNIPIEGNDMQIISSKMDFIGVNYYNEKVIAWSDTEPFNEKEQPMWEEHTSGIHWPITPFGLVRLMRWTNDYTNGSLPIYITENGASCNDVLTKDGRVHDSQRIQYLQQHLKMCSQVLKEGIPLKGYFCWSFIDNYEWTHGYSMRFGIVYCDYKTQKRYPKDSAYFLRDFNTGYGEF